MAQRETRLLWEYLKETYPNDTWVTNVELGPLPAEEVVMRGLKATAARLRPFRRRIDAVHWTKDRYDLIECKIRDPMPGLGGLVVYEALAKTTPDLVGYEGQPFHKTLVVPSSLAWIVEAGREMGVEIVEFWKPWVADYVREVQNYFTRDYRIARDEKVERRKLLGLE